MILIEDTHWPLVVVGVHDGAHVDRIGQVQAEWRWRQSEPRLLVLIAPGAGENALQAYEALTLWCEEHLTTGVGCWAIAWVIPDRAVRAAVDLYAAIGVPPAPTAAFGTVSAAFSWVSDVASWATALASRCRR